MKVNAWGINNLVGVYSGKVIYISTDHVFNGNKFFGNGYLEKHAPNPVNDYGRTKAAGELVSQAGKAETKIIRTSKLFNLKVRKQLEFIKKIGTPMVFSNILKRSFLHVDHFAEGIQFVVDNWDKIPSLLNISGTDIMTHYMFYCAIGNHLGINPNLIKSRNRYINGEQAPRPRRCGLNVSLAKSLGVPLYSAHEGIKLL